MRYPVGDESRLGHLKNTRESPGILVAHVPIDFSTGANNFVDAAIAWTLPQVASTEIVDVGSPIPQFDFPAIGTTVILALVVFCEKRTPDLERSVPSELEGVPVRLVESGQFVAR